MCELIASEARRFKYLLNSDRLDDDEKKLYRDLISLQEGRETVLAVKLKFSLKKISELLYKHYNQKVIVLIDEYDVPLDKAFQHGYYREMVSLIRPGAVCGHSFLRMLSRSHSHSGISFQKNTMTA